MFHAILTQIDRPPSICILGETSVRSLIPMLIAFAARPMIGLAQSSPSRPPDRSATVSKDLPPALQFPVRQGFRVVKTFKAASGLTGWVLRQPDGQYTVTYTTADGQTLLAGQLLSSSGQDLSDLYAKQYVPAPDLSALWAKLQKADVAVAGTLRAPRSTIYVIMDPNCIYCHMLWIALKPYETAGLQIRWIPVGFLHQDSAAKAAAILKGGEAALTQCQEHFDSKSESGGIAGIAITPALQAKLESNLKLMREANIQGTPGIFYKDSAGKVLRQEGMPSMSQLPAITGLPAQRETDPQLAQFSN